MSSAPTWRCLNCSAYKPVLDEESGSYCCGECGSEYEVKTSKESKEVSSSSPKKSEGFREVFGDEFKKRTSKEFPFREENPAGKTHNR